MRIHTFLIVLMLLSFSCPDNDDKEIPLCGTNNPIEELAWLKSVINEINLPDSLFAKYFYISQASYKGETIFIIDNCCPTCNTAIIIYDCEGEILGYLGDKIRIDEIDYSKIIYKPNDFACNLN